MRYRYVSCPTWYKRIVSDRLKETHAVKHIPAWIPRLSYKPAAQAGFDAGQDLLRYPMEFVKDEFVRYFVYFARRNCI